MLGSTIIGLEDHTPENIDAVIDYAMAHDTDFHQFMLYTAIPGTRLYAEQQAKGTLLDPQCDEVADAHGQLRFNYQHQGIPAGLETQFLLRAFTRDFEVNGPSIAWAAHDASGLESATTITPMRPHFCARYRWEGRDLATISAGALWAARQWFADNPKLRARLDQVLHDIYSAMGLKARLACAPGGPLYPSQAAARRPTGWRRVGPTSRPPSAKPTSTPRPRTGPSPCWATPAAGWRQPPTGA